MSNIVEFTPKDEHVTGPAICSACGHKWQAVSPAGTCGLECPDCGKFKGVWSRAIMAAGGEDLYECNCGGVLFIILRDQFMCAECGDRVCV